MKIVRRIALAAAAGLMALGIIGAGAGAPAQAGPDDSSWGWKAPTTGL
ncbi:MAG: hypothetical protein ACSLEW_05505 [Nocardioides sp.]